MRNPNCTVGAHLQCIIDLFVALGDKHFKVLWVLICIHHCKAIMLTKLSRLQWFYSVLIWCCMKILTEPPAFSDVNLILHQPHIQWEIWQSNETFSCTCGSCSCWAWGLTLSVCPYIWCRFICLLNWQSLWLFLMLPWYDTWQVEGEK